MIAPYPPHVMRWLATKGKCDHCGKSYAEPACGKSDHYRTCLDLAYEYLDEQATTDELNEPQEEIACL